MLHCDPNGLLCPLFLLFTAGPPVLLFFEGVECAKAPDYVVSSAISLALR